MAILDDLAAKLGRAGYSNEDVRKSLIATSTTFALGDLWVTLLGGTP